MEELQFGEGDEAETCIAKLGKGCKHQDFRNQKIT